MTYEEPNHAGQGCVEQGQSVVTAAMENLIGSSGTRILVLE